MHSKLKLNPHYKLHILMFTFCLLTPLNTVQADITKESDNFTHTVYFSPHAAFIPTGKNITLNTYTDYDQIYYTTTCKIHIASVRYYVYTMLILWYAIYNH